MKATEQEQPKQAVVIKPLNERQAKFRITGTAPYVQHKFSSKVATILAEGMAAGSVAKSKKKRAPKEFDRLGREATHVSDDGWEGIPAASLRAAMISACRLVGYKMTLAKMSVFVVADGYEHDEHATTPLVRITKGKPVVRLSPVRNFSGVVDIRPRPEWDLGWEALPILRWDGDQFSVGDIANLLSRAGAQVGIGEGRPDSRASAGCGWGTFSVTGG